MKYWTSFLLLMFLVILSYSTGLCHEIRPGYLKITESGKNEYQVTWKIPKSQNKYLDLTPSFNPAQNLELIKENFLIDAVLRKYKFTSQQSLKGTEIIIPNLEKTLVDVLVQVDFIDQSSYTFLLQPSDASYKIPNQWSLWKIAKTYLLLGVEHILRGYDHLFFVLGLILIIPGFKMLFKTITSFTIAHSVTLIMASLGVVTVPSKPVEAVIALSIILFAKEAHSYHKGQRSLTIRYPWVVAFIFGLIHGFGFAGALSEIGLPQKSIPFALVTFNIGVEMGQVLFIVFIESILYLLKNYFTKFNLFIDRLLPYVLGSVSSFWLIERILSF